MGPIGIPYSNNDWAFFGQTHVQCQSKSRHDVCKEIYYNRKCYCLTCILLYVCTMYSTYRKIVCMYLCTYAYIQCVNYLVLIRWPWRKGLSNSLSLSSPRLHCLASGLQNTIMGHCFSEVATGFFTFKYNFKKKNLWISSCCID